jgi:serine/threonine protein phosphatase PrpC
MAKRRSSAVTKSAKAQGAVSGIVGAVSDVGRSRSNNEDNYVIFDYARKKADRPAKEVRLSSARPGFLLVVADGMGGHSSGQVASQLCVDTLPPELVKLLPDGGDTPEASGEALKAAISTTNAVIHGEAQRKASDKGMGTTLTTAWIMGSKAVIGQVGDSRAYLLRKGQITQLTHDQTVLNSVSEAEREALVNTPFENMLLQAVGALPTVEADISTTELQTGDFLLLCSDGLYRVVQPEEMAEVLKGSESNQKKAETLIQMANDGGGPDNVTVIICEVQGGKAG